ncbi:MAG: branched-chain amino acid transport system II carrier protein, partial [Chlamydiia bacterium]|nr:branched-chain amino acid transport system II carrier protein [Chlamydiia bacterium]
SIYRKSRMIEVLGYFLTPALLICLGILWAVGMSGTSAPPASDLTGAAVFHTGLAHGYETMDLIASFFFSTSIITVIQAEKLPMGKSIRKALLSGFFGMGILSVVYLGIIYMAARNAPLMQTLSKEQLLPFISQQFLGPHLSMIPVGVIMLACMTTSVAMLSVFSDFLQDTFLKNVEQKKMAAILSGVVLTYFLSLFTFDGLMVVTTPILEISCPLLILLTLYNLGKRFFFSKSSVIAQVPVPE